MQSIPKKIHSYSAYLIFQKVKLKKAKISVFLLSFYQDHFILKWSSVKSFQHQSSPEIKHNATSSRLPSETTVG